MRISPSRTHIATSRLHKKWFEFELHLIFGLLLLVASHFQDVQARHPESDWDIPIPMPYGEESGPDDFESDLESRGETRSGAAGGSINNSIGIRASKSSSWNRKSRLYECGEAALNNLTLPEPVGYLMNGERQIRGQWPSFVRLKLYTNRGVGRNCGGALISDRHVLTAAHCVQGVYAGQAFLGEHDLDRWDPYEQVMEIEKDIFVARDFSESKDGAMVYDYAVVILAWPAHFNKHIQPACMPWGVDIQVDKRSRCYVVGAGLAKFEKNDSALVDDATFPPVGGNFVQQMRVRSVYCRGKWGIEDTDESRACWVKYEGNGNACQGDSGGPILCLGPDKLWYLTGLVSYGSAQCDGAGPGGWVGVYTKLWTLLDHIERDCGVHW